MRYSFGLSLPSAFQFTPLREGRHALLLRFILALRISIHAPPRGATVPVFSMPTSTVNFNSRPSARGDVLETETDFYRQKFQFTPLREGRRLMPCWRHQRRFISIHAPPRGATLLALTCLPMAFYFNSRPSARGDFYEGSMHKVYTISIHAPPRGATID